MPIPNPLGLDKLVEEAGADRLSAITGVRGIAIAILIVGIVLGNRWLKRHHLTVGQWVNLMLRSNKDV